MEQKNVTLIKRGTTENICWPIGHTLDRSKSSLKHKVLPITNPVTQDHGIWDVRMDCCKIVQCSYDPFSGCDNVGI